MELVSEYSGDPINSILENKNELKLKLRKDKIVEGRCNRRNEHDDVVSQIIRKEQELSKELHEISGLKSVPGLILEIETNLSLLEFESCYHSLKTLRKKLNDNAFMLNKSFGLHQSVARFIDDLHSRIVLKLHEICNMFWELKKDCIAFHDLIKYGSNQIEMKYEVFIEIIERLFFPQGLIDSNNWFIADMVQADLQENVRNTLKSILNNNVQLINVIEKIKNRLYMKNEQITLENNQSVLVFGSIQNDPEKVVEATIKSFQSITGFIEHLASSRDKSILSKNLCPMLDNELLKFIKLNSFAILKSENNQYKDKILLVTSRLSKLSRAVKGRTNATIKEIEDLLNSDQLYVELQLEKVFQEHMEKLRLLFKGNFKEVTSVELDQHMTKPKGLESTSIYEKSSIKSDNEEAADWDWDADEGWDDHINVDLDTDIISRSSMKSGKNEKNEKRDEKNVVEDVDDGWDEDWNVDFDAEDEKKSVKNIKLTNTIEITPLPNKFTMLINEFEENYEMACGKNPDKQYYHHKLNVLQTTYMAMCIPYFEQDWWLLYNDTSYLPQSLTRLHELALNYLDFNIKTREKFAHQILSQQLRELKTNEHTPSWDHTINSLLPFIQNDVIRPFTLLSNDTAMECIRRFLKFVYYDCILEQILRWNIISEKGSENLSEFIELISAKTTVPIMNSDNEYQSIREKFSIVGRFLPLHLKDIMDMFYRGDFYLFTTEEIIQWIVLLFADTPLRRNAIDDIKEIRNVDMEGE